MICANNAFVFDGEADPIEFDFKNKRNNTIQVPSLNQQDDVFPGTL